MDVEKSIKVTDFKIFGKTLFSIQTKFETNYKEDVEPLQPTIEIEFNDRYNHN